MSHQRRRRRTKIPTLEELQKGQTWKLVAKIDTVPFQDTSPPGLGSIALWIAEDKSYLVKEYEQDGERRVSVQETTFQEVARHPRLAEAAIGHLAFLLRTTRR